jgi:RHS repeat-associated protein
VTTSYVYDGVDRITKINQGSLTARQLAYDGVSHVIGEVIPEVNNNACTASDTHQYSVCYNYDSAGRLSSRVRPRPNQAAGGTALTTTSYSYDELNRLRIVNYDDTATENTPAQVFFYDPTGGIGKLASAISENHALNTGYTFDNHTYDSMGRVASDQQTVAVPSWVQQTFSYNYNLVGEPLTANFSNFSLTSQYNSAARLTQVTSSLNDATHPPTLFSNLQYNQFGQLTSDSLGNGVNETFGFDLRGRLTSASAVKGTNSIYSLGGPGTNNTMTYTPNSGLSATNDSVNGSWSYGYDALNRIASANKSGGTNLSFDIDRNANRWHQNPNGTQVGFNSATNQIASGNGVTYDAAGNIINDGNCAYTYDAEYRITAVTVVAGTCTAANYLYDAFGRRAQRAIGANTYDELYDLGGNVVMELTPSGGVPDYEVFMGGRHLATYSNNSTYFPHTDWLGTERVRTDPSGNIAVSCTSNPYGNNQVCTGSDQSRIHYAGMEYDSESQLFHTLLRYYNPRLGLWMTTDPAGLDASSPSDPQSLNRSAYVGNSPINSVDPLGRNQVKIDAPAPTGPQIDPFDLLNAYFSWYNGLFLPGANGFPANISDYDFNAIDSALASILAESGSGSSFDDGGGLFGLPPGVAQPSPLQVFLADLPWNNPCNPYNNPWGSDLCGFGSAIGGIPSLGIDPGRVLVAESFE